MDKKNKECFDLNKLSEKSELEIHKLGAIIRNLTAGEYFDMLSELMRKAPMFTENLLKLINRDGDRNTYKNLVDMFSLLKNMGYDKHEVDFDGMRDSYDTGQQRLTAMYAKRILDSFDNLRTRIEASRITGPLEDYYANPYEVSVKDWLDYHYMESDARKPVILAVDDSPMILKSISSILSDDYKVYMLAKSVMLEKMLSQIKPDLFLLDYNMPDINGFELIPVIRSFAEHKQTPIIFLTSEGTIDNISSAVMLGASDFIAKPVQPSTLHSRISKHIKHKQ